MLPNFLLLSTFPKPVAVVPVAKHVPVVHVARLIHVFPVVDNLVLRIPILYGDVGYLDESAITTLFKLLLNPPTSGKPRNDVTIISCDIDYETCLKIISSYKKFLSMFRSVFEELFHKKFEIKK